MPKGVDIILSGLKFDMFTVKHIKPCIPKLEPGVAVTCGEVYKKPHLSEVFAARPSVVLGNLCSGMCILYDACNFCGRSAVIIGRHDTIKLHPPIEVRSIKVGPNTRVALYDQYYWMRYDS